MTELNPKYDQVYAVVRFQAYHAHDRGEMRQRDFAVVKVVRSEAAAQDEVERLNSVNRQKGSLYFYQPTRLERDESDAGPSR